MFHLDRLLLNACSSNDLKNAKLLIEKGANVGARDDENCQPLHHACISDNYEIAKLLIDNGADVEAQDSNGMRPLHYAYDLNIAKLLLSKGVDVNPEDKSGLTPLIYVYEQYGEDAVIELLLNFGADPYVEGQITEDLLEIGIKLHILPLKQLAFLKLRSEKMEQDPSYQIILDQLLS